MVILYILNVFKMMEDNENIDESKAHLTSTFFYDESELFKESKARSKFDDNYSIYY